MSEEHRSGEAPGPASAHAWGHDVAGASKFEPDGEAPASATGSLEARLRESLDCLGDACYLLDREWRFVHLNREAERVLCRSAAELLGVELWSAFPETREGTLFQEYHLALATSEFRRFEFFHASLEVWFEVDAHPGADGLTVFFRNVTARRQFEARVRDAQRLESIGELSGGMAHDFNNLLTVIEGNAGLLREALDDDARLAPLLTSIDDAARRGADLTRRMLAFARRQTLDPVTTDIDALIDNLGVLLRRALGPGVGLRVAPGTELWPAVVDASQLEHSLINLALNARDAMAGNGTLVIETANVAVSAVSARVDIPAGDYVCIAVSDTGCGIPASLRGRIFEPFFTTKEKGRGTGLGLSMVFGFMKQSGGHISLYSEPGEGTTFRLYLPRAQAEPGFAPSRPGASAEPSPGKGERILVVEDDDAVRALVVRTLDEAGYRVFEAADAWQGLAVLEAGLEVDLLFTDMMMPGGMNGRELVEAARRLRPDLAVLYTSGYAEKAVSLQGRVPAATHFQAKPYPPRELLRKLREVLDGR